MPGVFPGKSPRSGPRGLQIGPRQYKTQAGALRGRARKTTEVRSASPSFVDGQGANLKRVDAQASSSCHLAFTNLDTLSGDGFHVTRRNPVLASERNRPSLDRTLVTTL